MQCTHMVSCSILKNQQTHGQRCITAESQFFFLIQKLKLCHIRQLLHVAVLYITAKEKKKGGEGDKEPGRNYDLKLFYLFSLGPMIMDGCRLDHLFHHM